MKATIYSKYSERTGRTEYYNSSIIEGIRDWYGEPHEVDIPEGFEPSDYPRAYRGFECNGEAWELLSAESWEYRGKKADRKLYSSLRVWLENEESGETITLISEEKAH